MRKPLEADSAKVAEDSRLRTSGRFKKSRPSLRWGVMVGGVILFAAAGLWVGFASSGKLALRTLIGRPIGLNARSEGKVAPSGRLTVVESAALALTEGFRLGKREKLSSALRQLKSGTGDETREEALFALLETGEDVDAVAAIRGFATLGGAANHKRLAHIMNDEGWSDTLRTEAAAALLQTGDPAEALLAIRAFGVIGGDANTDRLDQITKDASLSQALRLEAALALGIIASPRAGDALIDAFGRFSEPEIHEQLLESLGHFPFPQIEFTWKEFLNDPNTSNELRVAAVDALSNSSAEALAFLKTLAASDRDPNVRERAAWAISAHGDNGLLGRELAGLAALESEPDVRRRLYEALLAQAENPAETLLPLIRTETDIAARVAGFNALGDAVKRTSSNALAAEFDSEIVPELTRIALSTNNLNIRMRAVFALRRAGTAAANDALLVISKTQTPQIAQAATHGLRPMK